MWLKLLESILYGPVRFSGNFGRDRMDEAEGLRKLRDEEGWRVEEMTWVSLW